MIGYFLADRQKVQEINNGFSGPLTASIIIIIITQSGIHYALLSMHGSGSDFGDIFAACASLSGVNFE